MIKAVTSGTLAPYFYVNDDSELTGVDIDIVKEVFNRLPQYELKIEQADALQGVLSGQYDIAVNNYGYTDERAESYYFSLPYKTSFNEYIQRTGDEPLTSLIDLADRGYKIELSAGSLTAMHWKMEYRQPGSPDQYRILQCKLPGPLPAHRRWNR